MKKVIGVITGLSMAAATPVTAFAAQPIQGAFPSDPPPNAAPGQCFQRVRHDARYNTIREDYVVADGYEVHEFYLNGQRVDRDVVEPILETNSRQYMSREAGMRYRVTEPVYETVTEQVMIQPAYSRYQVIPAQYSTVTERVLIKESQLLWKAGYHEGAKSMRHDAETGEIWCLVEEPAQYRTIERTIVSEPSRVVEIPVPAEYATISKEVLVQAAQIQEIPIEAQYASYQYQTVSAPAEVRSRYVDERYGAYERHEMISSQYYQWVQVECDELAYSHSSENYGAGEYNAGEYNKEYSKTPAPSYKGSKREEPADLPDYSNVPVASLDTRAAQSVIYTADNPKPARSWSYQPAGTN